MENKFNISSLFPTPVLNCSLPSQLANITSFLDSQPLKTLGEGYYGTNSLNTYILNDDKCKELRSFILEMALNFGKELGYICDEYKITQSWITHKYPNQSHAPHSHSNSLFSGVFYYGSQFKSDCSSIKFHKPGSNHQDIAHPNTENSLFLTETVSYLPTSGDLLIFPSTLVHSVPKNTTNEIRKSLAFNIVPKNGLGHETTLTELKFN